MKIGIDARFLGPKGTGLGRYVQELIANLEILDKKNEYIIYSMRRSLKDLGIENNNLRYRSIPDLFKYRHQWMGSWVSWYYSGIAAQLLIDRPDVFLSPYLVLPWYCSCPKIT